MASPQESANKEVKMKFDVVRIKKNAARSKIISALITVLISGLLVSIPIPANAAACVPTSTTVGIETIVKFQTVGTCTWSPPANISVYQVLVVGAGGGGGSSLGGGGGGGRVIYQSNATISNTVTITVGAGGNGGSGSYSASTNNGKTGGTSSLSDGTLSVTSLGGSGGNGRYSATSKSSDGYTGGGGAYANSPAEIAVAGVGGSDFIGGDGSGSGGGGGGGAGGPGVARGAVSNASSGGIGVSNSITGTATYYGGGGGASWYGGNTNWTGVGGLGGGGNGANGSSGSAAGTSGTANTGGGGGGGYDGLTGGNGGSGIVIISYLPEGYSMLAFNSNGGTGAKSGIAAQNGVQVTNIPDVTGFSRNGYSFTGWNIAASGTGTSYAVGSSITISSATTLYARWSRTPSPSCAAGVGQGGIKTSTIANNKGGNGCVGIGYTLSGVGSMVNFNYTGADQSWTVPTGVTSATFYLFGAGGGGGTSYAGGGGGYATGSYAVTAGQTLKVIVGQGGGGAAFAAVAGYPGKYTPLTYGGGGRGGSFSAGWEGYYSSGGGRSAIRLPGSSTDLATAAGGGGAGYGQCGLGGGGTTGNSGTRGGTQSAGGTGAASGNGYPGTNGVAYLGGDSKDEGGGGGGGYYGGGGGGDNTAGGGGSSYVALLTNGSTTSGGDCGAAAASTGLINIVTYDSNNATSGSVPNESSVATSGGTLTLAANSGTLARTNYTFAGWNTAASGGGTSYAVGATTFVPSGDATLYARWNSTITFNGNGQTSATGTVPAAITAVGTTNTTLATVGTMVRTGFTFAGWNTQADGLGTNYASGLTTYQSTGNITLYAKWTATITYNTNGASGSPATSSSNSTARTSDLLINSVSPIALSSLPTVGTMVKAGYTFAGWNTAANGTGTNYSPSAPQPYMRLVASNFNDTTNAWTDSSGNNRNIAGTATTSTTGNIRGNPTLEDTTGTALAPANGSTATFKTVKGGTTDGIVLGNEALTKYTLCHVARYAGATKDRIFAGVTGNWLSGYWSNRTGVAYHEGWITSESGTNDTNWRVMCDTGGGPSGLRSNGVIKTTVTTNATGLPANITINLQGGRTTTAGVSDWEVAEVVIYDGILNQYQIETLEDSLKTTYGISGYTSPTTPAAAGSFTPTGDTTLYARWLPNAYTVTYDTSTVTSGTMATAWFSAGTAFSLPTNTFTRTGYTFKNWNTALNGSGTTYTNAQSLTLNASTTLYPQWTLLAPSVGTLAASAGNTEVTITPTPVTASATVGPTTSVTITAYTSQSTVSVFNPSKTCTVVSPATSCVITGLTNGTIYYFKSVATNATGSSTYATYVSATPAGVLVTYNATTNSGTTATASATYNKPTALTLPVATKTGYVFSGWYTASTSGTLIGGSGASYTPTTAITLYAQFSGIQYTISYNGNGNGAGTVPASGTFETGGSAYTILGGTNAPTRVGYTFDGWYTTSTGSGGTAYAVGASYSTTANLSLFAKWSAKTHTVTYALDSGSSSATTTQLTGKVVGNTVTLPASSTMSKSGYTFAGWSDGTSTYAGGATWTVPASDADFTLTAQWTVVTLSYSYDTNGGGTAPAGGTKTYGQTLVLDGATSLSKIGYTFAGWNDGSTTSNAGASVTINANKVYVAQWSALSYTITYTANGGAGTAPTVGSYVAGGVPYAIAANTFTKAGYNFSGWKNADATAFIVGSGYSTAANLTLIAQWSAASYTITYNANGATSGTAPTAGTLTTGVTYNAESNPSGSLLAKTGYTFNGWNTAANGSGTSYAVAAAVTTTSNITLYARWTIVSPAITFNKGIAETITLPATTTSQYGSLFTLPSTDTSTVIALGNYAFTGWSDGTNVYQVNSTYRMGTADVVFTAQWVAVYTVKYVLNGGAGSVPADVLRENGFDETLTAEVPTKTGFTLSGWKDQSGATIPAGSAAWKISGTSYIAYAQWTATQRTLTFDVNGGSGSEASITGKIIAELVTLPIPSSERAGYTFAGWSNNGTTYPAGGTFTVGTANFAFTAVWVGNTNTITYNGNGATGGTSPGNASYVTGAVSPYTVAANSGTLVKEGFTFDGWYTTATGADGTGYVAGSGTLTTTSDLTLFAKWTAATYVVTYDTAGGSTAPSPATKAYGSTFNLEAAPTKDGNTFLGWEIGSGASANTYAPNSSFTMGSAAITFTAKWIGVYYAVTYSLNGGAGSTPTQANVASGGSFTTAAPPTKSGYTFTGWSNGTTSTNASTLISSVSTNITLTAQWTIEAPGTPGTATAAPGDGSATITIVAPSSGGTPSSYTVTASNGSTCTVVSPGTSCTIAPLTNGTAYTFTTTATNSAGTSASSSSASNSVTPAGVPSTPTGVTGSGTGGSATINWSVPTSDGGSALTDYVIEFSVLDSGTWTTFADGTSTATSAVVTGLIAGSSYQFRVTAKNIIGSSIASFSSPTVATLPSSPTIATTTAASEQVTVTWNAPTHLGSGTLTGAEYVVTAYDAQGNDAGSCSPTSGQTTCVVTGLDNGSPYTFKVAVVTTVGTSAQSSASAPATPAGVPSAPANVVATTSGSNMTITFEAPSDNGGAAITSYAITSDPAGATCTVGANATTYTCTGLTAGTNYTYTVKAVNVKGQSSASLASSPVTAVAAPSAPQNVSAVITAGTTTLSATVSFDPPATNNGSEITSYTVTASPGGATCTVSAPVTFCDIPILPDRVYTFTARATNAVGTSVASTTTLEIKATNGIAPSLKVDPISAPTGELVENKVLTSTTTVDSYESTPNSVITYVWKRCTSELDETSCTTISGATSSTYTLTSADVGNYIRVETTATNSIGTVTNLSTATAVISAAAVTTPTTTPTTPVVDPTPAEPTCNAACQAASSAVAKAAADKAAADAAAKATADKSAADAAAKIKADSAATTASTKANADAAAAATAAKAAIDKAAAAAVAQVAADTAAKAAAAQAKAASDAQAAAAKAAADAAAALRNATTTAAAKAAATATAQKAAATAAAAVKAAATAAQQAAKAKTVATNANKQVDIAINSLNSKTAASQASAQANAIAAAAKTAANEAAAAAATKATEAKTAATAAQKAAADTAARIATQQKQAADAAAQAKVAADAAVKATAEKIAAETTATKAAQDLAKVLADKAVLADQAAKETDQVARAEIQKKIDEVTTKVEEVQKSVDDATTKLDAATTAQVSATQTSEDATKEAQTQATEAVAVKAESVVKTAEATKAVAAATVAAKVATAAKAAAAKVPAKATVVPKANTSTSKNSAKATVTGLKPGQKVKVTVNVKGK